MFPKEVNYLRYNPMVLYNQLNSVIQKNMDDKLWRKKLEIAATPSI